MQFYRPQLEGIQHGTKCEYPGCTIQVGHTIENGWEDQNNQRRRTVSWISRIKKNTDGPTEVSSEYVEITV